MRGMEKEGSKTGKNGLITDVNGDEDGEIWQSGASTEEGDTGMSNIFACSRCRSYFSVLNAALYKGCEEVSMDTLVIARELLLFMMAEGMHVCKNAEWAKDWGVVSRSG